MREKAIDNYYIIFCGILAVDVKKSGTVVAKMVESGHKAVFKGDVYMVMATDMTPKELAFTVDFIKRNKGILNDRKVELQDA